MQNLFRTIALVLREHVSDTYTLLAAADAVVNVVETEAEQRAALHRPKVVSPDGNATWNYNTKQWDYDTTYLHRVAMDSDEILRWVRDKRKINAIKHLRTLVPALPLKAAKDAIESDLVGAKAALYTDPWAPGTDEPPF